MLLEKSNLRLAWDCHSSNYLDRHVVSGVQDPRINGQSILTRAWLADTLWPGRFDALIDEELRFGAVLTWIAMELERRSTRYELLDAVESTDRTRAPHFVLATDLPDGSFDCLYCHDLLEHLSLDALECALAEMFRIARTDILLHFFNGKSSGDHEVIPVGRYYRNRLSMTRIAAFFERLGATATVLEMDRWLREKTGSPAYHNPHAFSLLVEKASGLAK